MSWNGNVSNEDGLTVKFGQDRAALKESGITSAEEKVLTFKIEGEKLVDADTDASDGHDAFIPAGALIKDAVLLVSEAFTSDGSAVLDLGFKEADGSTVDDDGVDAAIALGSLTAGAAIVSDGADIGTAAATDVYVTATYDTAAFTGGKATLVIKFVDA